ncbi:hypothetical protein VP01_783g2 [Puccinia sorghi]|uniref:Uncharacterized protein n=1 Tax=Puccinia sorghi TaxID=27349 RepID=A0A0L6UB40_9BASI|nr:hypothetical protein VP01_783g2 [Puccinia sorghi]
MKYDSVFRERQATLGCALSSRTQETTETCDFGIKKGTHEIISLANLGLSKMPAAKATSRPRSGPFFFSDFRWVLDLAKSARGQLNQYKRVGRRAPGSQGQEWGKVQDIYDQYAINKNQMACEVDPIKIKFRSLVDAKKAHGRDTVCSCRFRDWKMMMKHNKSSTIFWVDMPLLGKGKLNISISQENKIAADQSQIKTNYCSSRAPDSGWTSTPGASNCHKSIVECKLTAREQSHKLTRIGLLPKLTMYLPTKNVRQNQLQDNINAFFNSEAIWLNDSQDVANIKIGTKKKRIYFTLYKPQDHIKLREF